MALKGLDVFKLTPKTNCKDCGNPTCMAFAMKVAQGAAAIDKCPHLTAEALKMVSEASEPPMKLITTGAGGAEHKLGGETVLFRHDKTFVSKTLYAANIRAGNADAALEQIQKIDYERIGERMYIEAINAEYSGDKDAYAAIVQKALAAGRALILEVKDPDAARAALEIAAVCRPVLNAADESNYQVMNELAVQYGVTLGVTGKTLDSLHDTIAALEAAGNKNLIIDVGSVSVKDAFAKTVQIRRAALKDGDRTFGYPSLVNVSRLSPGDYHMQTALAALFTVKYGSIIVMDRISHSQALPLYGLRQNIFTDPQKPMKVEPGIYPINGADENAVCAVTVDFALTYFIVSGELERSGVPVNLLISDSGGYSVLTAWAAGKFSAGSIAKFVKESNIEEKIRNRNLIIPGKTAVLKGELAENLPGWKIIVAPNEAVELVKFLKEFKA
ncbi:MAG: acetyl-CoA decarbonylase/synthase complex subunit gamma [Treponema sp.]|jgi:acetyl-CoA decarbonylase/synthase complex subunit gamma|nr:acetyl-CoA decarbonylase/synthase complex subunit gamma [Treponema sp.]